MTTELLQTVDGRDVALEDLGNWLRDKLNTRWSGTVNAVVCSSGAIATANQLPVLIIYRRRCSGSSLQNCSIRLEYMTADNPDRASGDAKFRALTVAIAQHLHEFNLMQVMHPLQIDLGSLQCEYRFPMARVDFDATDTVDLRQF